MSRCPRQKYTLGPTSQRESVIGDPLGVKSKVGAFGKGEVTPSGFVVGGGIVVSFHVGEYASRLYIMEVNKDNDYQYMSSAPSHLYFRSCLSVGWSVRTSVMQTLDDPHARQLAYLALFHVNDVMIRVQENINKELSRRCIAVARR